MTTDQDRMQELKAKAHEIARRIEHKVNDLDGYWVDEIEKEFMAFEAESRTQPAPEPLELKVCCEWCHADYLMSEGHKCSTSNNTVVPAPASQAAEASDDALRAIIAPLEKLANRLTAPHQFMQVEAADMRIIFAALAAERQSHEEDMRLTVESHNCTVKALNKMIVKMESELAAAEATRDVAIDQVKTECTSAMRQAVEHERQKAQSDLDAAIADTVRMCADVAHKFYAADGHDIADEIMLTVSPAVLASQTAREKMAFRSGQCRFREAVDAKMMELRQTSIHPGQVEFCHVALMDIPFAKDETQEAREKRIMAEARLEEAKWWEPTFCGPTDKGRERIAELQAELEAACTPKSGCASSKE